MFNSRFLLQQIEASVSCHGCASGRKARSDDEPSSLPLTLLSKISKMGKDPLTSIDSSKADPVMYAIASKHGMHECGSVRRFMFCRWEH